ncbi:hypothetical protein SAMN03159463_05980 [Mesorhizobium sp. NFR06]|nr:hypothetical protein SAMN03159463_05980 [Mesorhizobium sp. NFR06]
MNTYEPEGRGIAAELLSLELATARQRVNQAERSLERAEGMLDDECSVAVGFALCGRIRAEQASAKAARRRLLKINSAR